MLHTGLIWDNHYYLFRLCFLANFIFELNPVSTDGSVLVAATLMKDLMEKRLASMVERP